MINSYKPGPPLRSFVDCFWHSEGYAPKHDRERLLPTGTVNLAINLRQDRIRVFESETEKSAHEFTGAVVSGTYSRCFVLETLSKRRSSASTFAREVLRRFSVYPTRTRRSARCTGRRLGRFRT